LETIGGYQNKIKKEQEKIGKIEAREAELKKKDQSLTLLEEGERWAAKENISNYKSKINKIEQTAHDMEKLMQADKGSINANFLDDADKDYQNFNNRMAAYAFIPDSGIGENLVKQEYGTAIYKAGRDAALIILGGNLFKWVGGKMMPVAAGEKVALELGKQGKHIPGHNNYIPGRSPLTHKNPQGLLNDFAGKGQPVGSVPRGQPGFKERVNFGQVIGEINGQPTTNGIIHYSKDGAHIVPATP
jgi:hypothetical protein